MPMYSSIKVVFCWRFFSPMDDPLIFDDQFSTRFAIMFPQSLGFYILIHLMAVLNLRQYMLFAQFRSLFSSWQDKLLKSQPSSFSRLVFVFLALRRIPGQRGSLDQFKWSWRGYPITWLPSTAPWRTLWVLLHHPLPQPLDLIISIHFPSSQSPPNIPFTFQSPTQASSSLCSETDKHTGTSRQRSLWRGTKSSVKWLVLY